MNWYAIAQDIDIIEKNRLILINRASSSGLICLSLLAHVSERSYAVRWEEAFQRDPQKEAARVLWHCFGSRRMHGSTVRALRLRATPLYLRAVKLKLPRTHQAKRGVKGKKVMTSSGWKKQQERNCSLITIAMVRLPIVRVTIWLRGHNRTNVGAGLRAGPPLDR